MVNFRLHPDAVPKKDNEDPSRYSNLAEFARELIHKEGWSKYFEVLHESGTEIVRIQYRPAPSEDESRDPPIVYMGSEQSFREGGIKRADIRSDLAAFLRELRA